MASLGGRYLNAHRTQYAPDSPPRTRREGCAPTSLANGADAATRGRINKTGAEVHALVPKMMETNPHTPGWSTVDLERAAAKLGVPYARRDGRGWSGVLEALNAGCYVLLAGDSDQFPDGTCSGEFDGTHTIGVHPASRTIGLQRQRWIDDPICPAGRWEFEYVLRRYAAKFDPDVSFGVFTDPVPRALARV